jgi:ankyrin repeat protein
MRAPAYKPPRTIAVLAQAAFALFASAAPATGEPLLFEAADANDLVSVVSLLVNGTDPNSRGIDRSTALHWAARAQALAVLDALIEAGADVHAQDRYGVTPAYLAAESGNEAVIARLLSAGADANSIAPNGESLLMTTTRTGNQSAMGLLIEHGALVDAAEPSYEQTPLMIAVREDHAGAAALLIARGANVDARTRAGSAPRFVLPCKGTGCGSEGVGINRGGLPNRGRRDAASGGMSPLLYAARDGRFGIARLLIEAGADIERAEANGIRPLLMALLNNQLAVARLLLDAGADPDGDDFWGRTPLFATIEFRNLDMNSREQDSPTTNGVVREPLLAFARALLEAGANPNSRTRDVPPQRRWIYSLGDVSWVDFTGQTPFLRAALSADLPGMRLLLEHGADPNIATLAGTTPLMAAAGVNWVVAQTFTDSKQAELEAVALCLELGNDINATNSMGLSALLGAANRGANEIIEFLADNGADVDVIDVEGRNAMRWAEGVFLAAVGAEQKPETIALLQRLGEAAGERREADLRD